ncbi:MAG: NUDIX domain-containing protein [Jatrophihabitantaceae bacterium]
MRDRYRVAVYVFDRRPGSVRLLCFDHTDFPDAGTQIPAGGVNQAETLEAAGTREVFEEAGVRITQTRALAVQVIEDQASQVRKVTMAPIRRDSGHRFVVRSNPHSPTPTLTRPNHCGKW